MSEYGPGKGSGTKSLYDGLTTKRCPPTDASMDLTKASVNDGAVRSESGKSSKTIGPRTA